MTIKITLWAEDTSFGIGWVGTTDENADMRRHGYIKYDTVTIPGTEDEVYALIATDKKAKKAELMATRNKLLRQIEEIEALL